MKNKTILITGASQGIGYESALALAQMGAKIIMLGRDEARTKAAMEQIVAKTNNENISYLLADLSSLEQVRELAAKFKRDYQKLDVLLNNAGAMSAKRKLSADGYEITWALNHLSYFLLTHELLDILKESGRRGKKSRIINVASMAHKRAIIDFDDIEGERHYAKWKAYGQSKLANIMFTYALARRLKQSNVTANCLHPGVVGTGFINHIGKMEKALSPIIKLFLISPARGAKTNIYLASSSEVEDVSGAYFANCKAIKSSDYSYNEEIQERLWDLSMAQINI